MLYTGDVRQILPTLEDESVNCIVTSPPYWGLRDYGVEGQLGLESTPDEYIENMVCVFRELRRVLCKDGTCWVNIGDSYWRNPKRGNQEVGGHAGLHTGRGVAGAMQHKSWHLPEKNLTGIPFRVVLRLQNDGWIWRSHIVWAKKACMPESVTDRPTCAHESIFLLTKSARYWYDAEAVKEPWESGRDDMRKHGVRTGAAYIQQGSTRSNSDKGPRAAERNQHNYEGMRNLRNVWHLGSEPYPEAHFATFPSEIPRRCILAGCPKDGAVLDPFMGSGTTAMVAQELGRKWIGIELNPEYAKMIDKRARQYGMAI